MSDPKNAAPAAAINDACPLCTERAAEETARIAAAVAFQEAVGRLALDRTFAMNLPRSIDMKPEIDHLGVATAKIFASEIKVLERSFGRDLPKLVACANATYWHAAWEGACAIELSIADGTVLDNDYTRQQTTPEGYLAINGGGASVMDSVPFTQRRALFSRLLSLTEMSGLEPFFEDDNETVQSALQSAMSCYLFQRANEFSVQQRPVAEVMELVCEAHALRSQLLANTVWNDAIEFAREDPDFQSNVRRTQARAAALARLSTDPKQRDKALVRECWEAWQAKPESYPSQAAFARDMLTKCAHLVNTRTVEDWCREWGKAAASA